MRDRGISRYLGSGEEYDVKLVARVLEFQRHEASNRGLI